MKWLHTWCNLNLLNPWYPELIWRDVLHPWHTVELMNLDRVHDGSLSLAATMIKRGVKIFCNLIKCLISGLTSFIFKIKWLKKLIRIHLKMFWLHILHTNSNILQYVNIPSKVWYIRMLSGEALHGRISP